MSSTAPAYSADLGDTATDAYPVLREQFMTAYAFARQVSQQVARMTSAEDDIPFGDGTLFMLTPDGLSGFYITPDDMLGGLFSLARGRGDQLVATAVRYGATHLDCFDGYLPTLYGRHGFTETARERNWTSGAPDVVYMSLANAQRVAA